MRALISALTTAVVGSTILAGTATSAGAATGVPLGLTSFSDMVVDEAHGHVFVSDGVGQVLVRDLDGAAVTSLTGLDKPAGMTLSDDGATLYVALHSSQILVVDATTLATTTLDAGTDACPIDVATTSGLLWVSNPCGGLFGQVDALDPGTGTVTPSVADAGVVLLVASPALPDTLLWFEVGSSPGTLTVADVSMSPGPGLAVRASAQVGSNTRDAAISPDGTRVVTASGSPYQHPVYDTADLSPAGSFASDAYPNAVAYRPDGMLAAGISGWYEPDVYVYPAGSSTLFRKYEFGGTSNELLPAGLEFGTERLYAVTGNLYSNTNYRLQVITPRPASKVTVTTDRSTYEYGRKSKVSVRLTATAGAQRQVQIYAQEQGGVRRLAATGTVPVGGTLTKSIAVKRATTFTAEYAGDSQADVASGKDSVKVHAKIKTKAIGYLRKSGRYYLWSASKKAYVFGNVLPNHAGDCEYFQGQFLVRGRWGYSDTTSCVTLSSDSWAGVYLKGDRRLIPYPFRFRAIFKSASGNLGTTSTWVYGRFVAGNGRPVAQRPLSPSVSELRAPDL